MRRVNYFDLLLMVKEADEMGFKKGPTTDDLRVLVTALDSLIECIQMTIEDRKAQGEEVPNVS